MEFRNGFIQESYNPVDYWFTWPENGPDADWYEWDYRAGHAEAKRVRNERAKELRAAGYRVKCCTEPNQLISRGGIGTGKPHIELIVTCYMLNAYPPRL